MREVEVNGREHWFVDRCNVPHEDMLAYTIYGGHEYWTTIKQVREAGHCAIYIVDEVGLEDVFDRVPRENIITIYITARILTRLDRGVSESRIIRDDQRRKLSPNTYDITIDNDGSIDSLRREIHSELFRKFDEIRNRFDTKHIKVIKNESTCDNLHQSNI